MKQLILIFCLLLCFASASASHHRGSYITFKRDTTQNPNPRRLFFTLTVFTDKSSYADSPLVDIKMGDGNKITVPRLSITAIGDTSTMIDREVYKWEYTYASDGTYSVSHLIINRNPNILNMTPPSDQSPIYIQTTVNLNSGLGINSSPQFLSPKPVFASIGRAVNYNFSAYDPDGDSLAYKLITPQSINASGNIIPVAGYILPDQTFKCRNSTNTDDARFVFSESDGQFIWDAPCRLGEYNYAVAVEEWRNGIKLSEVTYDMQILVADKQEQKLYLQKKEDQKFNSEDYLIARINRELRLEIIYENLEPDTYLVPDKTGGEKLFVSELAQILNVPITYNTVKTAYGSVGTLTFTPTKDLIRNKPYFLSFYGEKNGWPLTTSIGLIIRDDQPIIRMKGQNELYKTDEGHFVILTNREAKLSMFAENLEGYVQTLSIESPLAANATQFDFTVRDTTDGKVGELLFQPSEAQLSEAPQTITFKATYNPARFAGERTTYVGQPIVKEMQVQVIVTQQQPTATPDELAAATYLIYPNPAQDRFTVQAETPAILSIYTLQGKLILQQQLQPGTTEVNRPSATSGLYFYTLTTQSGHKKTGKLILQ